MEISQETINQALRKAEHTDVDAYPCILLRNPIDHTKVDLYTACNVDEKWPMKLSELVSEGYTVFLIKTEVGVTGRQTIAFFAKMQVE